MQRTLLQIRYLERELYQKALKRLTLFLFGKFNFLSLSFEYHLYVLACNSYVLVCHPYVTCMYSYVIRTYSYVLLCTRMSSVCHSYVLVCHSYDTRLWLKKLTSQNTKKFSDLVVGKM